MSDLGRVDIYICAEGIVIAFIVRVDYVLSGQQMISKFRREGRKEKREELR